MALIRDPLSDVLELIHVHGQEVTGFSEPEGSQRRFKGDAACLHLMETGRVQLTAVGEVNTRILQPGDVALLPAGKPHALRTLAAPAATPLRAQNILGAKRTQGTAAASWVTGSFTFDGALAKRFLEALPSVIHLASDNGLLSTQFEFARQTLMQESRENRLGAAVMISRILDLLFVQTIRGWLASQPAGVSWLSGMLDPKIANSLKAIHAAPGHPWTVEELARRAAMSRSVFAERFQRLVGESPLAYVTAWRLDRAAELLRYSGTSISEAADQTGYGSTTAFTRAFRLRFGNTPNRFRRRS